MPEVIAFLRARNIGAHSAVDPRGLDAVVSEAMARCRLRKEGYERA
jgi:hypothetical protein